MTKNDRSQSKILVIGAGIIGASIGYHLAKRGADVVLVDDVGAAAGATGKSFAWINAHHFKKPDYHRLRYQSLAEYHRLDRELQGSLGLNWCGALSFDAPGNAFDQRVEGFQRLGYPIEVVSQNRFREFEPNYSHPPDRALFLSMEAALDPAKACRALIDAAVSHGAQTLFGAEVIALRQDQGRLTGVETQEGSIDAGHIVVAAGVGADNLLKTIGINLPMANRSGIMLKSRAIEPTINHIIWGDRIHIKQQHDGRLIIGEIFSENWTDRDPDMIAEQMLADAKRHLPDINLEIEHMTIGLRPIPSDGMPVLGYAEGVDGLSIAVMHSGLTLAPIIGRTTADEILDGVHFDMLAPYRLSRFHDNDTKATS